MTKVSKAPQAVKFSAIEIVVLGNAVIFVTVETKKLVKISDRFKSELDAIQVISEKIEAGNIDFTADETSILARGLELATKSARRLKSIEPARFKNELEVIAELQNRFNIVVPEKPKRVRTPKVQDAEFEQIPSTEDVAKVEQVFESI